MTTFDAQSYWESRLRANWGVSGVGYQKFGAQYNRWMYRVMTAVFRRQVQSLREDWTRTEVLDIGSGTGHFVRLWQEAGARSVSAADFTEIAREKLRTTFPALEVYPLDIGAALPEPLADRTFDVVSAFAVLFHIMDDDSYRRAFENIGRLVRPGGLFVFSENFLHGPAARTRNFVGWRLADIEALLDANGFRIVKRTPMFVLMNAPVDTRGTAARAVWQSAMAPVQRFNALGGLIGALLYPPELLLTSLLSESPSTEVMVCERLQ
jgi:SAM-dependent methyltransferase